MLKVHGRITYADLLTFHGDVRFLWGFEGARAGLDVVRDAARGSNYQGQVGGILQRLDYLGVPGPDLRLNLSATLCPMDGIRVQLSALNVLNVFPNRRYSYDTGHADPAPRKVRFIEEPFAMWLRLGYQH